MLEIVIPLIALAIIFYVLYQNTLADSLEYPYTVFPLIVAGWLVLGLLIIAFVPGLARRIGEGLAREEGMPWRARRRVARGRPAGAGRPPCGGSLSRRAACRSRAAT